MSLRQRVWIISSSLSHWSSHKFPPSNFGIRARDEYCEGALCGKLEASFYVISTLMVSKEKSSHICAAKITQSLSLFGEDESIIKVLASLCGFLSLKIPGDLQRWKLIWVQNLSLVEYSNWFVHISLSFVVSLKFNCKHSSKITRYFWNWYWFW
jgi:hypothetical protein